MKISTLIALLAAVGLAAGTYFVIRGNEPRLDAIAPEGGGEEHGDDHGDEHGGEEAEARTTITAEAAKVAGIMVEEAGKVMLNDRLPLTGKIMLSPSASAEVKARFAGVVRSVRKNIGQTVTKGEVLATVESNDSLQTYAVTSPLAGVVVGRTINVGDTAGEQVIFSVADLGQMVAEFAVFPRDLTRIQVGQQVQVQSMDGAVSADGTVKAVLPTANAETQTVMAWVALENGDGRWRAGMAVQGGAVIGQEEVPLAVKASAIQTMEDKPVVFVQEDDAYEARPVQLGRSDGVYTEVTSGLVAGDKYVARNSFVVKADIGKAGVAHAH